MDDMNLKEELRSCQLYLVECERERARHKVFNYAIENLNATKVNVRFGHFFNRLRCAAKMNLAFSFILKNIEDGGFGSSYAHEINTLLARSKVVCSKDDLAKQKDVFTKIDVIESCSKERMNTKWMFYELPNSTLSAALLKDVPY